MTKKEFFIASIVAIIMTLGFCLLGTITADKLNNDPSYSER